MPSWRGSLTIAGSGVATIVLNDPAAKAFIRKKNPKVYDMYQLYDDGKPRLETYVQMTDVMLSKVRSGQDVVALFYGHPGVFVQPSHRAIKIAREEGYPAKMLPGISAEACLFADLGVGPAVNGTTTYEATDWPTTTH